MIVYIIWKIGGNKSSPNCPLLIPGIHLVPVMRLLKIRYLLLLKYKLLFCPIVSLCRPILLPRRYILTGSHLLNSRHMLKALIFWSSNIGFYLEESKNVVVSLHILKLFLHITLIIVNLGSFFNSLSLFTSLFFLDLLLPLSWYRSVFSFYLFFTVFYYTNIFKTLNPPIISIGAFSHILNFFLLLQVPWNILILVVGCCDSLINNKWVEGGVNIINWRLRWEGFC